MIISDIAHFTAATTALDAAFAAITKAESKGWTKAVNGAFKAHLRRPLPGVTVEMLYGAGSGIAEMLMDPAQRPRLHARGAAMLAGAQSPIDALPHDLVVILREKATPELAEALAAAGLVCHTDARKTRGISCSIWQGRAAPAIIRGLVAGAGQVVPVPAPSDAETSETGAAAAPMRSEDETIQECEGGAKAAAASECEDSTRDLPKEHSDDRVEMASNVDSPPSEASVTPSDESAEVASRATPIDGGDQRGSASKSRVSVGPTRGRGFMRRAASPTKDAQEQNGSAPDETIGQGSPKADPEESSSRDSSAVDAAAPVDASPIGESRMTDDAPPPISAEAPDTPSSAPSTAPGAADIRVDADAEEIPGFLRDD